MVIKICIVLFIINGCATYVNVNVQKPSKISLGKIRNVAILDIDKKELQCIIKTGALLCKNNTNKLILGDSHSVSIYKPGYCINRNDGKTLNGFLNIGIKWIDTCTYLHHLEHIHVACMKENT